MAQQKRSTGLRILLALLLAGGLGYGAWYKWGRQTVQPIVVQTEKVTRRDLTELVMATGKIQPVVFVKISPEVSGEITELPVKEGQRVKKGDLLLKIKPDTYVASRNIAEANFKSAQARNGLEKATLEKVETEFRRMDSLFRSGLISESEHVTARTALDGAKASVLSASHQIETAQASLARAEEDLSKTTIYSPLDGAITKLNSQAGERVVGTATYQGTEVMTISDLATMEARVDIGEVDVVLIAVGQKARLEVDAFRDRKFTGVVSEIANSAKTSAQMTSQTEATKFEVRIRIQEKEAFRTGMSVTAEIETRYRTNVLSVPIQSVTTRLPKGSGQAGDTNAASAGKPAAAAKPFEVAFVIETNTAQMLPVTRGINDDTYVEITQGLNEGAEVVSGGYKAINRELEDGKKVQVDNAKKEHRPVADKDKDKEDKN